MKLLNRDCAIQILKNKYPLSKFVNPEDAVEVWKKFVKQVISGKYNGNENEYWNDLDARMIIEEIGYSQDAEVMLADEEFKNKLINTGVRIWGGDKPNIDDWWNFGYPATLVGYLKDYFESDN